MTDTVYEIPVNDVLVAGYFSSLVNRVFKILPIKEREEKTLETYLDSLSMELLGCKSLIPSLGDDGAYLSILASIRYIHDNPDLPLPIVRREVFRTISVCKKIEGRYAAEVSK